MHCIFIADFVCIVPRTNTCKAILAGGRCKKYPVAGLDGYCTVGHLELNRYGAEVSPKRNAHAQPSKPTESGADATLFSDTEADDEVKSNATTTKTAAAPAEQQVQVPSAILLSVVLIALLAYIVLEL